MKFETFLDVLTARNRHTVPEQFLERQLLIQVSNFAIMSRYPVMVEHCKWFLQTTADFAATNSLIGIDLGLSAAGSRIAKPADCWALLGVRVNEAKNKCATRLDVRQRGMVQASSLQKGTADYPKYQEDKDTIDLLGRDDYTGTFDYLRMPSFIDDEQFELTDANDAALPAFHWFLEEEILNEADYQLRERARGAADAPSAIAQMAQAITQSMDNLAKASDPRALYGLTLPGRLS